MSYLILLMLFFLSRTDIGSSDSSPVNCEAEEKKQKEREERRKRKEEREAEKRRRQEEVEKRKKEEEEKKKQEEVERRKREQEKAKKRTEELKLKREKAEQLRREEEERQKRDEEERIKLEAEKKKRKEEEIRRRKEEEKRKKLEEEERRIREEEEAKRRAEEERQKREEEERWQLEEELRCKREEEERIKQEAEEKRLREEEERRRLEEEKARKKEEARRRLEQQYNEREKLRKEAEEIAWRKDPNNWKPEIYERACDEVDGTQEYHGGINCVLTSPIGGIEKDDLECLASDEVDSIITVLEDDEKPVSSVIDVQSKKESVHTLVPSRLYIPHNRKLSPSDEIVIKVSKDGNDWTTCGPVQSTSNLSELEKTNKGLAGIEVNDFTTLKVIVVSRPQRQTIIFDRPGVSVYSSVDKQVKLFVPRDTFENKTEMRMMIQTVGSDTLRDLVKNIPSLENVLSASSLITLLSTKSPRRSIEVTLSKSSANQAGTSKSPRGKFYQLYACRDKSWRIADVEYEGQQNNVTVSLPIGRDKITIMELEVPANVPKENIADIAEALQAYINKTACVLVVKQKRSNPRMCAVRIIRKEDIKRIVDYLENLGFDEGPGISGEFKVKEGQAIQLTCTGNIEIDPEQKIELEYMSYTGGAGTMCTVRVKDKYKQKDLPSYVGNIRCLLLKDKHSYPDNMTQSVEMPILLPKPVRIKSTVCFTKVRFPYYLTFLASYLAKVVRNNASFDWKAVMTTLMGEKGFRSGYRNAKRKFDEYANDDVLFKAILLDWMKAKPIHKDKLQTVMDALKDSGLSTLAYQCEEYVTLQKENLSDDVLKEISSNATKAVRDIGRDLGLHEHIVDRCTQVYEGDTTAQTEAVLIEWRETDHVLQHNDIKQYLTRVCA